MLNEQIKHYREINSLTQEELAQKINVSRSLVAKWEQGRGVPSKDSVAQLCSLFNIQENALFGYEEFVAVKVDNSKKKKLITSLIVISIVLFVVMSIFIGKAIVSNTPREFIYANINFGKLKYNVILDGPDIDYTIVEIKNEDFLEKVIENECFITMFEFKSTSYYDWYHSYKNYIGKECYLFKSPEYSASPSLVANSGDYFYMMIPCGDNTYRFDCLTRDMASLIGEPMEGEYDVYGEQIYYYVRVPQFIFKENKVKYQSGSVYQAAYTYNELKSVYQNATLNDEEQTITIKASLIGFIHKYNNTAFIKIRYIANDRFEITLIHN